METVCVSKFGSILTSVFLFVSFAGTPAASAGTKIFFDGFETGFPCSWSSTDPAVSCPPVFKGPALIAATGTSEISIGWLPAVDDSTPPSDMKYRVYVTEEEVGVKSAAKATAEHLVVGGEGIVLQGLQREWAYFIEVIAEDEDGMQSAMPSFGAIGEPPSPGGRQVVTLADDPVMRPSVELERAAELNLGEAVATETTLTFQFGQASTPPSIGAVLIGPLVGGGGYVREVEDVEIGESELVVETSPASIAVAAEAFQLSSSSSIFQVDEAQAAAIAAAKGHGLRGVHRTPLVEMRPVGNRSNTGDLVVRPLEGAGRYRVSAAKGLQFGNDFEVDIDIDFEPDFRTDLQWNAAGIKTAEVVATGSFEADVLARYTFSATASWAPDPIELFSTSWAHFYTIGSVPVYHVITLSVELQVSASATAAVKATASAGASSTIQVGARYDDTDGWTPIAGLDFEHSVETDIGVVGEAEAEVRLIPKVTIEFYEAAAGSISIEPSIGGHLAAEDTSVEPCFPFELTDFTVDLEAEANVAFNLTLFDDYELFSSTVWQSEKWVLFNLPTVALDSAGTGPVTITAEVTDGVRNAFDPDTADWRIDPDTATLTPVVGDPFSAELECPEEETYTVTFSGYGVLGPISRSCRQIVVDCAPPIPSSLMAWGSNQYGQLGIGSTENQSSPVAVPEVEDVVAMATGVHTSLVVLDDGTVWAWGRNQYGQLGDGTTVDSSVPVQVVGLNDVKMVAANDWRSFAVKNDGTVWAWGSNGDGYLGDGTMVDRPTPVQITGLSDVKAISTNASQFVMALKNDDTVWAWGYNFWGFGDGTRGGYSTPVQLTTLSNIMKISAGSAHYVALGRDNKVYTWGSGSSGRLGNGGNSDQWSPVLAHITDVIDVSAGYDHTLAVRSDGNVWGWGYNDLGQVGVPVLTNLNYLPIQAEGITGVASVTAGNQYSMALKTDGSLWMWGANWCGVYGNGTTGSAHWNKVQVPGLPAIEMSATLSCHVLAWTE